MATNSTAAARREERMLRAEEEHREQILSLVKAAPAGEMPAEARALIEERKMMNRVATEIANLSWGKGMDLQARAALAAYGRENGIDVLSEIDILGGKLYRNANYYMNRAVPYVHNGTIADMGGRYINADPRLVELAKGDGENAAKARAELEERAWLRIQHNVPEEAKATYLAYVQLANGNRFEAASWCGGGARKSDPIGDAEPTKTARTRATRKALMLVVPSVPQLRQIVERDEDEAVEVNAIIADARMSQKVRDAALAQPSHKALAAGAGSYGDDEPPVGVVQAVEDDAYGAPAHADTREED